MLLEVTPVSVDIASFLATLTGSITPAQILAIVGSVVGAGLVFYYTWFGIRKALSIFTKASTGKRISA